MGRAGWKGRMGGTGRKGWKGGWMGTALLLLSVPPFLPFQPLLPFQPVPAFQPFPSLQPPPTFRSTSTDLVVLPVVVTDARGQFVSELDRSLFAVFDNGRPAAVELFTNEDTPVTVGLVLDTSSSMRAKL